MKALNKKLLRDLWRLKGQAIAIAMVVMCGIATYVMTSTAMDSLTEAKNSYYERYRLADLFANAKRAPLQIVEQIRELDGVAVAYPRVQFPVRLDVEGLDESASALILSVPDVGEIPLNDLFVRKGRRPLPSENDRVMVSEAFATAHGFEPEDTLKAIINGRMRTLTISGIVLSPEFVYTLAPGHMFPDNLRYGTLWMNRRALEAATDMDGAFNNIVIRLSPKAKTKDIMFAIDQILKPYGGIDTFERENQLSYWFIQNELNQLKTMAVIVPTIFLGVAAFLLNIVLGRQIQLERDQIGMLKALGYGDRQIGLHYLGYALAIVFVGSALGTVLGYVVGKSLMGIYAQYFQFPELNYLFKASSLSIAMVVSLMAAVIATIGSVRKVVDLPPAEAMQQAPPMMYKKSFLDRLGLFKLFSTTFRMIVRHLERRPSRAIMSIVGVSLSASIFLSTIFLIDGLDLMLDVQYNVASREDVNVSFVEARSMRAMEDIRHLPGVLAAEPFRVVPARLRFGNKFHRGRITGITPEARLKRMIDINLNPITMPDKGVMLSTKLAEILGVSRGDLITIEVLIGRRPTLNLRVSGLAQEYIGANAFMSLESLNSAMGDGPVMSGAAVLTDKGHDAEMNAEIKKIPQIANAMMKMVALEAMKKSMTDSLVGTVIFTVFFAGLIAFGVIYNTARISLSERARELGSMRVLGFSEREVAFVLLGELTLLVLIAIPLGLWMGVGMAYGFAASMDTELFRLPVVISARTVASTVLVVLVSFFLSGWTVWAKVKELDIVKTLKTRE